MLLATFACTCLILAARADAPSAPDDESGALQQIRQLQRPVEPQDDLEQTLDQLTRQRTDLIKRIDEFVARFPTSEKRDDMLALKLETLFYLAAQRGQTLDELDAEADRILKKSPSRRLAAHAQYWKMRTRLVALERTGASLDEVDNLRLKLTTQFVDRYPTSPLTAPIAYELVRRAWERNDSAAAEKYIKLLRKNFPEHLYTKILRGQLLRINTIGKPVTFSLETTDGKTIDSAATKGRLVLVHFWAGFSPPSLANLDLLRRLYQQHHENGLVIIGVNLDADRKTLDALVSKHDIHWPQYHDGLGWAAKPVRRWAVRSLPVTLLIDRNGFLRVFDLSPDPAATLKPHLQLPASTKPAQ